MAKKSQQKTSWKENGILGILVLLLWSMGRLTRIFAFNETLYFAMHVVVFGFAVILIVRFLRARHMRPMWELLLYVYVCVALGASLYYAVNTQLAAPLTIQTIFSPAQQ